MTNTKDLSSNPLVNPPQLPHGAPPLDLIKPEHFLPAMEWAVEKAKANIETIKNNEAPPTFENTINALAFTDEDLDRIGAIFGELSGVLIGDELKAIEQPVTTLLTQHGSDVLFDDVLFARIEAVYNDFQARPEKYNHLRDDQKLLLKDTYDSFAKNGALLSPEAKQELRSIKERLSELSTTYKNNVVASVKEKTITIDNEAALDGVPERAKDAYKAFAEKSSQPDKWMIPLDPGYYVDVLEYATNRAVRKQVQLAAAAIAQSGPHDNRPLILEMVKLRHQKAQLLGFANHAELTLSERMAKTPQTVLNFLNKNLQTYKPQAETYRQGVKDFALQTDGITDFGPADFGYYDRKLQEQTFSIDLEELRPYFDLEKVLDGLRQHAEKLFNIEMKETAGKYPVYHPEVKVYEVFDKKSGDLIGLHYTDYYARVGEKSPGAHMNVFRNRGLNGKGENEFPIVTNVANFPKPSAGKLTLLSLDQVRTVFHEFGHGLHGLLAEGNYKSQTGTNVKWDFVELPSQLQENWYQQKEVLDSFARHAETGQPLPEELIKKVQDMQNYGAALMGLRQTYLGLLDMTWYTTDPSTITSVEEIEDRVDAVAAITPRTGLMSPRFTHIFSGGYSAGYYSYKWAEVLEADVFADFEANGLYDGTTADRLRETIYSKGGTVEPDKLFRAFKGRDPDPNALFRREGLLPKQDSPPKPSGPAPG